MNKIKTEKLVFGGQALARLNNKVLFLWNALPNEEVTFEIKANKKNFAEGFATKIISPSPYRIIPKEDHYLYCSPWQIIDWNKELEWKKEIAIETYKKIGSIELPSLEIYSDNKEFSYRNKIEYNFVESNGKISFAIFIPQTNIKEPIDLCELANPEINNVAKDILTWLNKCKIPPKYLNKIILRCNETGKILAGLFLNSKMQFEKYPDLNKCFVGFSICYVNGNNILTIYKSGQDYLEEELNGIKMRYGLFSFFQINTAVFKKTLSDIAPFINGEGLVDYYSGVGAIGLTMYKHCKNVVLVENSKEATAYAKINVDLNNLKDIEIVPLSVEKALNYISRDKTILFDPPRAGLDKTIIEKIMTEKPKKIIYLSCNLSTHARDIGLLQEEYEIKFMKLYNYFPRTPHIEGLCILELK